MFKFRMKHEQTSNKSRNNARLVRGVPRRKNAAFIGFSFHNNSNGIVKKIKISTSWLIHPFRATYMYFIKAENSWLMNRMFLIIRFLYTHIHIHGFLFYIYIHIYIYIYCMYIYYICIYILAYTKYMYTK